MNDKDYAYLTERVRKLLRLDLSAYKPDQMRRRLKNFIDRHAGISVSQFCQRLERDPALLDTLRDTLTINVSEFYRDRSQWDRFQNVVLPDLLQRRPQLKIWSAGCSNGQEPYTVTLLLAERGAERRARILATDFDRGTLARAGTGGPYQADDLRSLPPALVQKYFEAGDGGLRVIESLRRRISFREFNLLADPFERGFDLIICRNVLIYFSDSVKEELLRRFHASLADEGILFIGGTEAILGGERLGYERITGNFYRRLPAAA